MIMAPKDEAELASMLKTALRTSSPVAIRYPRGSGFGVEINHPEILQIGKAEIIKPGTGGAIIGIGIMATLALQAALELSENGLDIEVVNARFVKPLDEDTMEGILRKHKKIITIEENVLKGGFGSVILEFAERHGLECKIKNIGLPDEFIEAGPRSKLLEIYGLNKEGIVKAAKEHFLGK